MQKYAICSYRSQIFTSVGVQQMLWNPVKSCWDNIRFIRATAQVHAVIQNTKISFHFSFIFVFLIKQTVMKYQIRTF